MRTSITLRAQDGEFLDEWHPSRDRAEPFVLPVCLAPDSYVVEARDSTGREARLEIQVTGALEGSPLDVEMR